MTSAVDDEQCIKETFLDEDIVYWYIRLEDVTLDNFSAYYHGRYMFYIEDIIENHTYEWILLRIEKEDLCSIFSPRPYEQGYGCDGTADPHIHYIAYELCNRIGLDYGEIYMDTYGKREGSKKEDFLNWFLKPWIMESTIVPDDIDIHLVLEDLADINNYNLCEALQDAIEKRHHIGDFVYETRSVPIEGTTLLSAEYVNKFMQSTLVNS